MRHLLFFLLLSSTCFAQGAHRIGQVLVKGDGSTANVEAGAKVLICAVNTDCKTAANIYLDPALTSPARNPVTTDEAGNYDYYMASGCVDERISSSGHQDIFIPYVCSINTRSANAQFSNKFTACAPCSQNIFSQYLSPKVAQTANISNIGFSHSFTVSGPSKNTGDITGVPSGSDWTFDQGVSYNYNNYRAGISHVMGINYNRYGAGDGAILYAYGSTSGGAVAGADEGLTYFKLNGTEEKGYYAGTVANTSGPGDLAPVLSHSTSGPNHVVSQGYLIDTSHPLTSGNFAGFSTQAWNNTRLGKLPVSNAIPQSLAACTTNANLPYSVVLNAPDSHTITCTVEPGASPITMGHAWVYSPWAPEQVTVTSVSTVGSTQTITLSNAIVHSSGSVIMQSKYQGCISFDDDLTTPTNTTQGYRTDILVFGSLNNTLLIGERTLGGMVGGFPVFGAERQTASSPYHVYPCALIMAVNSTGRGVTLEANNVPWSTGDTVESPHPRSQWETGLEIDSTLNTPTNPSVPSSMVRLFMQGNGSNLDHHYFDLQNGTAYSAYLAKGGWLSPPSPFVLRGPMGQLFDMDLPINTGIGNTCGAAIFCFEQDQPGDRTASTNLFVDRQDGQSLIENRSNGSWDFSPLVNALGGYRNGGGTPAAGHVLRSNGSAFIDSSIQAPDLPTNLQSGTTVAGSPICTDSTGCGSSGVSSLNGLKGSLKIVAAGSNVSVAPTASGITISGAGGVTVSGSSCTITAITNGLITAATCVP